MRPLLFSFSAVASRSNNIETVDEDRAGAHWRRMKQTGKKLIEESPLEEELNRSQCCGRWPRCAPGGGGITAVGLRSFCPVIGSPCRSVMSEASLEHVDDISEANPKCLLS